jgi:hypothetical protein
MTEETDKLVKLDLGCCPEAAISGPLLLQTDYQCILTFNAQRPRADGYSDDAGTAIVEIVRCGTTKFGYPNDEALGGHPLSAKGLDNYGIYEVLNSSWIAEQAKQNQVCFPERTNISGKRHFIFVFHESVLECLAQDLKLTLSDDPYENIFKTISERILGGEI